jgi:hypothetical protein
MQELQQIDKLFSIHKVVTSANLPRFNRNMYFFNPALMQKVIKKLH